MILSAHFNISNALCGLWWGRRVYHGCRGSVTMVTGMSSRRDHLKLLPSPSTRECKPQRRCCRSVFRSGAAICHLPIVFPSQINIRLSILQVGARRKIWASIPSEAAPKRIRMVNVANTEVATRKFHHSRLHPAIASRIDRKIGTWSVGHCFAWQVRVRIPIVSLSLLVLEVTGPPQLLQQLMQLKRNG